MLLTTKNWTQNEHALHCKLMFFIFAIRLEAVLCCKENPGISVILERANV